MADIKFTFLGDTSDLEAAQQRAADGFEDAGESSANFAKAAKIGLAAAAAGAAVAAGAMVKLGKATLDLSAQANRYAKEAKKIGSTAEDIQRVEGAFALLTENGVSAGRMIQDLNRGLAEARDGAGPAKDALAKLGLAAGDLVGLPVADQIREIGVRIGAMGDIANQTQVSMDLFGRSGRELVGAFREGGAAVEAAFAQIEQAGIISNETAEQAEALEDSLELLGREFGTLSREALAPLIPQMLETIAVISGVVVAAQESDAVKDMAQFLMDVAGGAALAAGEMLELLGIIDRGEKKEGGIFADSAEIREQVEWINVLQNALDDAQAKAEQYADESGAWRESDLRQWENTNEALSEAKQKLKRLKAEASGQIKLDIVVPDIVLPRVVLPDVGAPAAAADVGAPSAPAGAEAPSAPAGPLAMIQAQQEALVAANAAVQASLKQTFDAYEKHTQSVLDAENAMWEDLGRIREQEHASEMARIQSEQQARASQFSGMLGAASSVLSSIGDFAVAAAEKGISAMDKQSASHKQARRDLWGVETGVAIAQAGLNIPLAISNAVANAKNPQEAVINGALAAVASGAALAGVIAKAAVGPSFHSGGVATAGDVGLGRDEFLATLRRGEGVLTPQAVTNAGGPAAVEAMNRGEHAGMHRPMLVAVQMNNRTVDLQHRAALHRPGSPISSALRKSQPQRLGRHNPFGG